MLELLHLEAFMESSCAAAQPGQIGRKPCCALGAYQTVADHSGERTSPQLFSIRMISAECVSVGGFARTYSMHHSVLCS